MTIDAVLTQYWRSIDAVLTQYWRSIDYIRKNDENITEKSEGLELATLHGQLWKNHRHVNYCQNFNSKV
jgi:hypothetical protein